MDFITIPLVVGMITLGIYKLFDLFVRKKERLAIIEKIGDKFDSSMIENKFSFPLNFKFEGGFGTLKVACLLLGVGLGLLVGYFICYGTIPGYYNNGDYSYRTSEVIYGASTLLFGGLGLLIAFLIEMKYRKDKKEH
ncbi:hypothetical protein Palpr_2115 [Paludibacter propionicigenes WB4]|uniref:DUF6249 domain-containing protein n=2 Tax=Paludibacter TaxID=346096 RepID=E4T6A7_PALPW|nr:hypothetical protein Palpr_2115 [Paludibacter propionicigenes WB4]